MITAEFCQRMAQYNATLNERLYAAAARLSEVERQRALGAFFGSLHGTLNHLMVGDLAWMARFAPGVSLPVDPTTITALNQILFDTFEPLHAARRTLDHAIITWADGITPDVLQSTLRYRRVNGQQASVALSVAVTHFFNHQTHHRGQASTLLTQLGQDIGVTDFIMMPDFLALQ